jgi:hypothetical protein
MSNWDPTTALRSASGPGQLKVDMSQALRRFACRRGGTGASTDGDHTRTSCACCLYGQQPNPILSATEKASGRIPGISGCFKASSRITTGQTETGT